MGKLYLTLNQLSNCYCDTSSSYPFSIHVLVIIRYTSLSTSLNRFILVLPCFLDVYLVHVNPNMTSFDWYVGEEKWWAVFGVEPMLTLKKHFKTKQKQFFFPIGKKKKKSLLLFLGVGGGSMLQCSTSIETKISTCWGLNGEMLQVHLEHQNMFYHVYRYCMNKVLTHNRQ